MVFAPSYQIGTAARMGPGFFPFALGGMLTMLGLVISLRSLSWGRGGRKTLSFQTRPVVFVLCSVILFSLVLRPLGLLLSAFILVLVSSMASYDFKVRQSILIAFVLLAIVLIIFVFFLKFQIPVWPSFLAGRT
jgi:ABC-type xylose transport system permease subunit